MADRRLVVVGASLAGLRAAESARHAGFDGTITLIGAEQHVPYYRPILSKMFLALDFELPMPALVYRQEEELRKELGVELVLGAPADGLDTAAREVSVGGATVGYDSLVIATGLRTRRIPGSEALKGVHTLRTAEDAAALRGALREGGRVVVVGAGFIGAEAASVARAMGLDVTLVDALPVPMADALGPEMGGVAAQLHEAGGAALRTGVTVTGLAGDGRVERVLLSDGSALEADLVVTGIGGTPATDWLDGSGVSVRDGVVCDPTLATGVPGVYAAGDVARWTNPLFGRDMRCEHWLSASEQGWAAGRNAVDPAHAEPFGHVPYFWSDWYGNRLQFMGVPEADEVEVFGSTEARDFVALYRTGTRLTGALTVNRKTSAPALRRLVRSRASWDEAVLLAKESTSATVSPAAG
ncbi:FAD-dependent oxidoreductase [Streptomyces sp. Je 1-79]|uniref:NAD(P)/FAD-dependent oxidoreductase n=1 Tax=Streptomyces sp. Je 1-79 TaxID=2943847 RepID=UPI0021A7EAFB|nr:FAD-dependent oxidoreductase [Streptomyces sp. Je 1-79]MCT4356210.1 FAD-dependent oxidoreductase [Streptomyces sp. Je 1-79]